MATRTKKECQEHQVLVLWRGSRLIGGDVDYDSDGYYDGEYSVMNLSDAKEGIYDDFMDEYALPLIYTWPELTPVEIVVPAKFLEFKVNGVTIDSIESM